ncbi:PRC-barrel domain-containing protein [Candidatus Saccharibacteria bacterium]|nr:PRC-barrel domain-containing protein [Candidatus Saccharibacteria bacterium]
MLIDASRLLGCPVLSLHVGAPIAHVENEIVNPDNLKIIAFEVWGAAIQNDPDAGEILESRDIREFSSLGMIVDSIEDFVNPGDVIKLDKVMKLNFSLIGLKVFTKKKTKLGKIVDFTVNTDDWTVRQLIVKRPIMKAIADPELVIPRKEIVEIFDDRIIVKDKEEKIKKISFKEEFVPNFVNPFREPDFSTNRIEREKSK